MNVFIIGITGRIGRILVQELQNRGDAVAGLVRTQDNADKLAADGVDPRIGDLSTMTAQELAMVLEGADAVVYTAGSNGGARETTEKIDRDGLVRAAEAATIAGISRFLLISVFPESWRERDLPDDEEYYFAVKKQAEVSLVRTDLDWLILRPALLTDDAGTGRVSLGPAELHNHVRRGDVATTVAALLHEPLISRQILELNHGEDPITSAVARIRPRTA